MVCVSMYSVLCGVGVGVEKGLPCSAISAPQYGSGSCPNTDSGDVRTLPCHNTKTEFMDLLLLSFTGVYADIVSTWCVLWKLYIDMYEWSLVESHVQR